MVALEIQYEYMNTQIAVKLGTSRQVVIPKIIHDELDLSPGDYLSVEKHGKNILFKPQIIGDREVMERLREGLDDIKAGRVDTFKNAREMFKFLDKGLANGTRHKHVSQKK